MAYADRQIVENNEQQVCNRFPNWADKIISKTRLYEHLNLDYKEVWNMSPDKQDDMIKRAFRQEILKKRNNE
jgi:hypothetical protein